MELLLMLGIDVRLEVTRSAESSIAVRTFVRPQSHVNLFNVTGEVTTLREFLGTVRTTEWFLLGVTSDVSFEQKGSLK